MSDVVGHQTLRQLFQDIGELYPLSRREHRQWGNVYLYVIHVKTPGDESFEAFLESLLYRIGPHLTLNCLAILAGSITALLHSVGLLQSLLTLSRRLRRA